jgi:hypothetical protein
MPLGFGVSLRDVPRLCGDVIRVLVMVAWQEARKGCWDPRPHGPCSVSYAVEVPWGLKFEK